ncbi:hypothetical protein VOLCADRAFT_105063 [Volvox carteri f. nagariensis]|uniref:Ribonuclease H2 subunit B n=1 Tax=Volvox carteri f. nagariensis TaxID=3068 RepID=D8TY49_VOLCA|nr:uncharacterized protein VOLCADRAFT_105063 [Volvox carteri f. nagariensis]EFJ47583.1 hypothetical protein VOLCADRAFT_105063 [Volvox carteri f. nagariensis]|eukprot:XP_002951407.1 hypothetical protein VOLCADRAFT_105063 [Volvox carteri f. nagariensis]
MASNSSEDDVWRVILLPGLERGQATTIKSFTLPDPRTARPQGFLLTHGSLLEVNRFKQSHSAWLVGDRLLADGGVFVATAYDPLFVLLPLLDRARDKDEGCPAGKFKEPNELLYDGVTPGLNELLPYVQGSGGTTDPKPAVDAAIAGSSDSKAAVPGSLVSEREPAGGDHHHGDAKEVEEAEELRSIPLATLTGLDQQLACICDVRRIDDTTYYRLNEDRVLAWLCCKFRRMRAALSAQLMGMDAPHAAAYVLGFLSEYVGDPWVRRVAKQVGISEELLAGNTTLRLMDPNNMQAATRLAAPPPPPLAGEPPEKKQKTQDLRVAAKQAALAKQAVGTKKLTSFFTKK